MVESLALVVPKKKAEPVRRRLMEKGLMRRNLQVKSDARNVYFPVVQRVDLGYQIETVDFREIEDAVSDYRQLVDVPDDVRPFLPSSYDTIGGIAVVKMDERVGPYASEIGKAILATQKSLRTVCVDSGVIEEFRTRNIKVVAGEHTTETIHKEYGISLKVDISKAFFSPRLATERDTVARQVQEGEVVIDMFAGVGPFSIIIAKTRRPKAVYSIDLNPEAVDLMKENIRLNKVDTVHPILGDARQAVADLEKADRIIMNLPHSGRDFLDAALGALKPSGVIHYYEILEKTELQGAIDHIADAARKHGRIMKELARREVKSYSPTMVFYGFDLQFLG